MSNRVCLQWRDYEACVSSAIRDLRQQSDQFDVTLRCSDEEGPSLQAHKIILSSGSGLFKTMLKQHHHRIHLRGTTFQMLSHALDFMYNGQVDVAQEDLSSFLAVAEELEIEGLNKQQWSKKKKEGGRNMEAEDGPSVQIHRSSSMGSDNFNLCRDNFEASLSSAIRDLRQKSDFFDVTLECSDEEGPSLQAHKVILMACSGYFKTMLRQQGSTRPRHPRIHLRGATFQDLSHVLDFMYNGQVKVAQEDFNSFLAVAEELEIEALKFKGKCWICQKVFMDAMSCYQHCIMNRQESSVNCLDLEKNDGTLNRQSIASCQLPVSQEKPGPASRKPGPASSKAAFSYPGPASTKPGPASSKAASSKAGQALSKVKAGPTSSQKANVEIDFRPCWKCGTILVSKSKELNELNAHLKKCSEELSSE